MDTIGERIKRSRENLEMSQEELAHKLGYESRSTIAKIEAGKNDIAQSKLAIFAEALQCSQEYLLIGTEKNKPSALARELSKKILDTTADFSHDETQKVLDYIELIKAARQSQKPK
jgi:transcriptional regulator with XRE-family HTH domain